VTVAVVIPWKPGCPHRQVNFEVVVAHLDWDVHVGTLDGPWCTARAVAQAVPQVDTLVIHDADVLVPPEALAQAVGAVEGGAVWAMPHRKVYRLTQALTAAMRDGQTVDHRRARLARHPYEGVKAGGVLVIRRDVYEECGFDPRFEGWGGEDEALWRALTLLYEPVVRFDADLVHLWHPWEKRQMSKATTQLLARYKGAFRSQDAAAMRTLVEEARCSTPTAS
jgi:hypothetical protein